MNLSQQLIEIYHRPTHQRKFYESKLVHSLVL